MSIEENMANFDSRLPAKLFGVALDASDDPWSLQLKLAAAEAVQKGVEGIYADPYDAVAPALLKCNQSVQGIGKFPLPSWLNPSPCLADCHLVTKENTGKFLSGGGLLELSRQLKNFVQNNVFPHMPIMLGIDHSATGGVVSALSEKLGVENLAVVVLDQHFDGIPLSLRMDTDTMVKYGCLADSASCISGASEGDEYCCGNFWKKLLDNGTLLPQNLLFVGVADFPAGEVEPGGERFRKNYLDLQAQGCKFFPLEQFEGSYLGRLQEFVKNNIKTENVYVSLDLDVGAHRCVHAARYMDRTGIARKALMDTAKMIRDFSRSGIFRLVGLDVMEFNVHYLDLQTSSGIKDDTASIALDFIRELLPENEEAKAAEDEDGR